MNINKVAVIGAGTMGNGIAHTFALYGFEVSLIEISNDALQRGLKTISLNLDKQIKKENINQTDKAATLERISIYTDLKAGVDGAGLVIEAATENLEVKLNIFKQLGTLCTAETILATNTSSIAITQIAAVTNYPQNVIGMHFMNPVPLMKLVEIIKGKLTSVTVIETVKHLARQLDKVPVEVNDAPGFIANRILMPMINEAIFALHEGVAGVEEIDTVMKLGMGHPMGPLQLADFIGLDVCLAIIHILYDGFKTEKYLPCPLLAEMVSNNELGLKTGSGFYLYTSGSKTLIVASRFRG